MKKGYLPPFDQDLEEVVIGALLTVKDSFIHISKDFSADVFYKESHRLIAESILRLSNESRRIDLLTVRSDLQKEGKLEIIGGMYYLTGLTDRVVTSAHIEDHFSTLVKHHFAREQILLYQEKINLLYEFQDPYEVAVDVGQKLIVMQKDSDSEHEFTMQDLAYNSIITREARGLDEIPFEGHTSGVKELDKALMGIKPPDLTIIAARPAMGKTAVVLSVAKSIASENEPVAIFSLEMSASQLYGRILSNETKIEGRKIKKNNLTDKEREFLNAGDNNLSGLPIIINDTPGLHIDKLRSLIAIYIQKYGIKAVVIDYLQLMRGSQKGNSSNRAQEVSEITGKLKRYCKEFGIPIIALSQLSRDVESRTGTGCKPILSDLRESGSIEQDADNVIFLWRPEYYNITQSVPVRGYKEGFNPEKLLLFIIAKCREGETKSVPALIELSTMSVSDHPDIWTDEIQTTLPF